MYEYKYSIIIPHFTKSGTELVERLVRSIPSRNDVQVLVVDNSPKSIDANLFNYHKQVEILFSNPKDGAGGARNLGIEKAKGKWLLFADADDYYVNGFLDVLDEELEDDLDVVYFSIQADNTDNVRANQFIGEFDKLYSTNKNLIRFRFWTPWNKVVSHELVNDNCLRYDIRPVGNDMRFCLLASDKAQKFKIINKALYVLTNQPASISYRKKSVDEMLEFLDLMVWQDRFFKEKKLKELRRPLISFSILNSFLKDYGLKGTIHYVKEFNKKTCFISALVRGSYLTLTYKIRH